MVIRKYNKNEVFGMFKDNVEKIKESFSTFDSIIGRLRNSGGVSIIFGGAIRDSLLGYEFDDIDVKTTLTEQEILKLFPNFKKRIRGHNQSLVYFGKYKDFFIEITRFEEDEIYTIEDLKKYHVTRDTTINNMFYDCEYIYDREAGIDDLLNKTLRIGNIKNFEKNVSERPMVLLKNLRLIAKLGLQPNKEFIEFLVRNKKILDEISELIFNNEGYKTMRYKHVPLLLAVLSKCGFVDITFRLEKQVAPHEELSKKDFEICAGYWAVNLSKSGISEILKFYKFPEERIKRAIQFVDYYNKRINENKNAPFIESKEDLKVFIVKRLVQKSSVYI